MGLTRKTDLFHGWSCIKLNNLGMEPGRAMKTA